MRHRFHRREDGTWVAEVSLTGRALCNDGLVNKGTAFSAEERRRFGLEGILPHQIASLEEQAVRAYGHIARKQSALERYIGLAALQDRNETLFYRVLGDHLEELLPIVYTPTVGEASQLFSQIYRRGRGVWITPEHQGRIGEIFDNLTDRDIRLIVVTDNERILGLGDQGAGGMGIPIGKLALYSVAAGFHPSQTLPVSLDVGTDNEGLLADKLYIGWPHPRLRGERYDELVEEFVEAVAGRFPRALLQWEDFKKGNAFALLEKYRTRLPSFNDDIQGTAAVAVGALMAACRAAGSELTEQRIVILGAGAAGVGISHQVRHALEDAGLAGTDLTRAIAMLDSRGLLIAERDFRDDYKREFAWPAELAAEIGLSASSGLLETVRAVRPTVLIGTSGVPDTFTEEVVREMAAHVPRPVIFPFSNPTANSEARPEDLVRWTEGRVLMATGSPFDPVEYEGRIHPVSQGNNVWVFPGVGLGAVVARARHLPDSFFTVAARTLAEMVSEAALASGRLLPRLERLREVSRRIAEAVVRQAREEGLGVEIADDEIGRAVELEMWTPRYPDLVVTPRREPV